MTATDVVLTVTEMLRKHGVVGKFVEFYGEGVAEVPLANRATLGNMSPEFGSTAAIFPIDEETIDYLRLTGRNDEQLALVEAYAKAQGMWHDPTREPVFSEYLELDLSDRGAVDRRAQAAAGPHRAVRREERLPQGHPQLRRGEPPGAGDQARRGRRGVLPGQRLGGAVLRRQRRRAAALGGVGAEGRPSKPVKVRSADRGEFVLDHGAVAIAAITSCTNTSNPVVMLGAALLASNAVEKGLTSKPWVKTTMAPGSQVVTDYYDKAGLWPYLEKLGFYLVGYGCTTCIGNSGPLSDEISAAINDNDLVGRRRCCPATATSRAASTQT